MKRFLQLFFLILVVVAGILLVWLAVRTLDDAALMLTDSNGGHDIVRGWSVALHLWPVMLTGAIPALIVAGGLAVWGLFAATNADQLREINRFQQAIDSATVRAEQAEHEAQSRYAERSRLAEQTEQQATQRMQAADTKMKEANIAVALAQQEAAPVSRG